MPEGLLLLPLLLLRSAWRGAAQGFPLAPHDPTLRGLWGERTWPAHPLLLPGDRGETGERAISAALHDLFPRPSPAAR